MTRLNATGLARDLAALFAAGSLANLTDGQLLDQFLAHRDDRSFQELIARHGPMVLAICRRSLADEHDVEDAFQATFLVLVRKAQALRDREALSSWLYGVALRVARRARNNARRRQFREQPIAAEPATTAHGHPDPAGDEVFAIVDQEIRRLSQNQQVAVMLCLLEGYTHEDAATRLGWPLGTVKSRIASARQVLTRRLARRGLTPSGIAAIVRPGPGFDGSSSPIPLDLVRRATAAALDSLAQPSLLSSMLSAPIKSLVEEFPKILLITRGQAAALLLITITPLAVTAPALLSARQSNPGPEAPPRARPSANSQPPVFQPPGTDLYGDPLPPGAVLRLGTIRYRQDTFINHIAYSPDGQLLVSDGEGRFFQLWDSKTGKKLRRIDSGLEHTRYFAFSPDGKTLAAVGTHDTGIQRLTLTDVASGQVVRRCEWTDPNNVRRVFYSPDGKALATANDSAGFEIRDVATLTSFHRESSTEGNRVSLAFSPVASSHLLAIARKDTIRFWDTEHQRDVRTITMENEYHSTDLIFSPDGSTVVTNTNRFKDNVHEFWLWNVADGTRLGRFASATDPHAYGMSFSPDGKTLAAIGEQDQLMCFDVATFKALKVLPGARAATKPLIFSPDGGTLTTIDGEHTLHFWDRATGKDRLATPGAHLDVVQSLDFLDAGKTLVSCGRDHTTRFWDLSTGRPTKALTQDRFPSSFAFRADGTPLAAGVTGDHTTAEIWNLHTGVPIRTVSINDPEGNSLFKGITLSRDASTATAVLNNGSLRSWDVVTGNERPIAQPKIPHDPSRGSDDLDLCLFSDDGQSLALISDEGAIKVIDVPSGKMRFETSATNRDLGLTEFIRRRPALAFAPDGRSLAFEKRFFKQTKRADGQTRVEWPRAGTIVWLDSQTGHVRREIAILESGAGRLAFSPDSQLIAATTSSGDHGASAIRVFRLRDKQEIQTIAVPSAWTEALRFTPSGTQIVAGLSDTSIVVWNVRRGD
jgi:RNA polymerase sigma factor (sigma-70 family)